MQNIIHNQQVGTQLLTCDFKHVNSNANSCKFAMNAFTIRHYCTEKANPALNRWGRVTHICTSRLTSIRSDNGLSPGWRQAIIWSMSPYGVTRPQWVNGSIMSCLCVCDFQWPLLLTGIQLLISAWISNHMSSKVWDEITYPFPNFNGCAIEVWEWISEFIPHFILDVITYSTIHKVCVT